MKLYTGDECFKLFKQCYYKYCLYSPTRLKNTRIEMYKKMEYANDYYGIHVKTLSRLEYMNKSYEKKAMNFNSSFWFDIFIKGIGLYNYILERNGVKTS